MAKTTTATKKTCLSEKEAKRSLKSLPDWKPNAKYTAITKTIATPNFISGLAFVAKITVFAEIMEHHPDVELAYTRVKLTLSTHDAKGLTKKDIDLAKKIDSLKV